MEFLLCFSPCNFFPAEPHYILGVLLNCLPLLPKVVNSAFFSQVPAKLSVQLVFFPPGSSFSTWHQPAPMFLGFPWRVFSLLWHCSPEVEFLMMPFLTSPRTKTLPFGVHCARDGHSDLQPSHSPQVFLHSPAAGPAVAFPSLLPHQPNQEVMCPHVPGISKALSSLLCCVLNRLLTSWSSPWKQGWVIVKLLPAT